jgi:multisubunit Na+/H+ antiporter MnhB subunit
MDTPTLVGTGFVVLGALIWVLCAYYCYQVAPRFQRRASVWAVLGLLFGPLALMVLYVLPKGNVVSDKGRGAEPGRPGTKRDRQAELYEVPKKHK